MHSHKRLYLDTSRSCCVSAFSHSAADKKSKDAKADDSSKPSYELPQPATENLDFTMYQRIREEGLEHSHVMEYASGLVDGIGPRLTGSPNLKRANEWTRDQFTAMGCSNAHLEDWGEFGMGWRQLNTWVRMSAPDTAVFIAQALPWSPSSHGPIERPRDLGRRERRKGSGEVQREAGGQDCFLRRDARRKAGRQAAVRAARRCQSEDHCRISGARGRARRFFRDISSSGWNFARRRDSSLPPSTRPAIVVPSRDGRNNGGSGGTIFDDGGAGMGWFTYQREHAEALPIVVMAIENYGRVYRLLKANVPVTRRDGCGNGIHRRPRARLRHDCRDSRHRSQAERRSGDGRRTPGFVGIRDGRDRQWRGNGGGDGSDAHPERAARAAAAHDPRGLVDRRRAGRVWIVRICEATFRIRAAVDRARSVEAAGLYAQARRSGADETGAAEDFRILQRRQRHREKFAASTCRRMPRWLRSSSSGLRRCRTWA